MTIIAAMLASFMMFAGVPAWAANNKAPTVSLTAPASGTAFTAPANITIGANASDPDGTIAKVEFFGGATPIGTRSAAPYSITWNNVAAGTYSLTARATDNAGASRTSSAVSVTVTAARLVVTYPPDGATIHGGSVAVTGTFAGDASTSTVLVDNGDSSVLATTSGNEFRATVALHDGPNALRVAVARRDGTSDSARVSVIGSRSPLVAFTAPNGSAFEASANVDFAVEAVSPASAIAGVAFLRNGSLLGVATSPPFRMSWQNVPGGTHVVTAIATDANGYTGGASRTISVSGPNAPPSVALISPAPGATFAAPAAIPLAAQAGDADGTVTKVEFLGDGSVVAVTNVAPYAATWSGVGPGSHTLTARATDDRSGVTTSAPVTVSVAAPNAPPVVNLTSPAGGSTFFAPAGIALAATAADPDGAVVEVEFFVGTTRVGRTTTPPYEATWSNPAAGSYLLTARAADNAGAVSTSAPVAIVVNANQAPAVSLTSPAPGASFAAPATVPLAASAIDVDGTVTRVEFFAGATLIGAASSPPWAASWTIVTPGSYSIFARATDDRGAVASSPAVTIDVTGPVLSIDAPPDTATIDGDVVGVSGTLQAPPNSGVTVNGIVAAVSGNRFYASGVRLNPGNNVISATLTTPDDLSATHTIDVVSTGAAPVRIVTAPTQGIGPLTVAFEVLPREGVTVRSVDIDADGDGSVDGSVAAPPWKVEATYVGPGVVLASIRVAHDSGAAVQQIPIVVTDEAEIDRTLRAVWGGMTAALATGDKALALRYLDPAARERYGPPFDALLPGMPQIVASWSELQSVTISERLGEYAINRVVNGVNRLFLVYFGRGGDGVWRVGSL